MSCESETYCPYIDHALMVAPYGEVRPCCRFDSNLYGSKLLWSDQSSLSDFYQTGVFSEIRTQMEQGERVPGCWRCYEEEKAGVPSMRQKPFPTPLSDKLDQLIPAFVEIGVGRTCNLRCRSCNASFSTRWESDAKLLNQNHAPLDQKVDLYKIPFEFLNRVQQIKITGGEPFLEKKFLNWLPNLCSHLKVQDKEIEIFTNGTAFPGSEFLKSLEKFGKITISMSVDACDRQNNYLRNPARWDRIEENSQRWLEWCNDRASTNFGFVATLSVYNILSVFDLVRWVQLKLGNDTKNLIFQTVHDPVWMSVERLPISLKKSLLISFRQKMEDFLDQNQVGHLIKSRLLRTEKLLMKEHADPIDPKEFLTNTRALDLIRNEKLSDVFPEIDGLFNNFLGNHESATL